LTGAAPFLFAMCSPYERGPATLAVHEAGARHVLLGSSPASTTGETSPPHPSPQASDNVAPTASKIAPYHGPLPETCAAMENMLAALLKERSCSSDLDCTNFAPNCVCAHAVKQDVAPKLAALEQAMSRKGCYRAGPARACATCPPPPERHCVSGSCQ
jgi:hypothetical protein